MALSGKKALVTGAKRRIGRGIVLALAQAGCDVGINDLERDADAEETLSLVRAMGREAEFYPADISDSGQVNAMTTDFVKRFGRIDILVNNPYWSQNMPFLDIDETTWDRTMAVCLKGFFLCAQAAAREMVKQGQGGSIVSTSSVHAKRAWPNDAGYGVAKAGILRMTESMALDLGQYGIRCNAVMPGYMNTDHLFDTAAPSVGSAPEGRHAFIPLRRHGTPEDIGRAVAFLCSPAAGNITGASLPVDGGLLATGVP
jgi:NAD(P)-dependent dehydrogenase (short-subunit alcohol dehydrogenase family)